MSPMIDKRSSRTRIWFLVLTGGYYLAIFVCEITLGMKSGLVWLWSFYSIEKQVTWSLSVHTIGYLLMLVFSSPRKKQTVPGQICDGFPGIALMCKDDKSRFPSFTGWLFEIIPFAFFTIMELCNLFHCHWFEYAWSNLGLIIVIIMYAGVCAACQFFICMLKSMDAAGGMG